MALIGTINGTTSNKYITAKIEWSATQNITNNTSTVTATLYYKKSSDSSERTAGRYSGNISINGVSTTIELDELYLATDDIWKQAGTATINVEHNTDGSKSITISATGGCPNTTFKSTSLSSIVTLDAIPRSSAVTMSTGNLTIGNGCNIKWTPASANFKYKVGLSLNNWSVTLPNNTNYITPSQTTEYTYDIGTAISESANDIYAQLPSSISGIMSVTLTTYNANGSQIGSVASTSFTVTIPSNVVPTVGTITLAPLTYSYLIQGKNKLQISVSGCYAGTGSDIKSYTFSGTGISSTTTATSVTSAQNISFVGTSNTSLTYTVTVTDNRNRSASRSASITCYAYSPPSITSFSAYKSDSQKNAKDDGTYLYCSYALTYSSTVPDNYVNLTIYYKKSGENNYSSYAALSQSKTTYSGSTLLANLNSSAAYTVYATITDRYGGTYSSTQSTAFAGDRILNIKSNGKGVAFGKLAEQDNVLESDWNVQFNNRLAIGQQFVGATDLDDYSFTVNGDIAVNGWSEATNLWAYEDIYADNNICTAGGIFVYDENYSNTIASITDQGDLTCNNLTVNGSFELTDVSCKNITATGNITLTSDTSTISSTYVNGTHVTGASIVGNIGIFGSVLLDSNDEHFCVPEIQYGKAQIQPSAANSLKSATITLNKTFSGKPLVFVNAADNTTAVTKLYGQATDASNIKIFIQQTNTNATTVYWMAIYNNLFLQDDTSTIKNAT